MSPTAVLHGLGDLVFLMDREQRVTAVYGRHIQAGVYPADQFLNKLMTREWPADVATIHCEMNARALEGQTVLYDWEFPMRGSGRRIMTTISPLFAKHGNTVIGLLRVSTDLAEQRPVATHAVQSVGILARSEETKSVLFRFSARERVIVSHLLNSSRTSQIARDLKISVHTTRQHFKNIFRKAGVHSQSELLDLLRHGRESMKAGAGSHARATPRKRGFKPR